MAKNYVSNKDETVRMFKSDFAQRLHTLQNCMMPALIGFVGASGRSVIILNTRVMGPHSGVIKRFKRDISPKPAIVPSAGEMPNAFVLGSLAVAIPLTALEADLSAMPAVVSNAGQLLLGCALGSRFQPDFLRGARRFVGAVATTVLLSIALAAAFGVALAWLAGQNAATLVLGNAPGGIAEMCITAKVLQPGVPLVP